uniref:Uncharacterized protein n=1 Tax=Astyanax mexicanus TaxID=7994 RepID=A0A8B9LF06_ASTMX
MQAALYNSRYIWTFQRHNDPKHRASQSLLTSISLIHFGEISNMQFMQDRPRMQRN